MAIFNRISAGSGRPSGSGLLRRSFLGVIGLVVALPFFASAAAADEAAESFIRELGDNAVSQLTAADLTDAERNERFRALLLSHFDVPQIGQYVLGRYWRNATPEEQTEYLELFENYLVASYARRFAEYTGQEFEVISSRSSDGLETVRSHIVTSNGEAAKLDWIVERQDGGLRILDLKVEGLSMSETHRSEFASVIQNNGGQVSALLDALRKKASGA
ncbi:MAG: ABC transporter substrate-binding protein [Dongiaceae bacterium]